MGNSFGTYPFGKIYLAKPRMRVREVAQFQGPFRPSVAIGGGTRIGSSFREGIIMLSFGHIADRFGLFAGLNFIDSGFEEVPDPATGQKANRHFDAKRKWVAGIDYTF